MHKHPERELFFDDPRLRMSAWGRFVVHAASSVTYLFFATFAVMALLSSVTWAWGLGALVALILIDRGLHLREGDRPISEVRYRARVNVAECIAPRAWHALERGYERAHLLKDNVVLEIMWDLVRRPEVREGLERLDVPPKEFIAHLKRVRATLPSTPLSREELFRRTQLIAIAAFSGAEQKKREFVDTDDIFSALAASDDEHVEGLMSAFAIEPGDLDRALAMSAMRRRFLRLRRIPATLGGFMFESHRGLRKRVMNRAWTARPTPLLDSVSIDFTARARGEEIGFLVGHEEEYERLTAALSRSLNPNALLVGEVGAGKETLIAHLAFQIVKDTVPPQIFDRRLLVLQIANLVAGAPPEELQKRLQKIVGEIATAGNIVLCIPDIHNLVKTSGTAYLSVADALIPIIRDNAFPIIGTTYPREFKSMIESRSDFASLFEVIRVEELDEKDAETLLAYESLILGRDAGVTVSFGAIKSAVRLAKKYFHDKLLPGSAEDLLKGAIVAASRSKERVVGPSLVIAAAEEKTNVPIHEASEAEAEQLLHLEEKIHERLVDQDEAVEAVANSLREYRSGLARAGGPIASFLFVGPTGVGKTELAKILAKIQFGSIDAMIRFDMTEYQDKQSFYRFIGSPDGAISGALTDAVREKPYSLILLDEFEKAFPDILHLFLQVIDDGRLTDNMSRTVDFQNTIIIATSNAHSDIINTALREGQSMGEIAEYLKAKLTDVFKPELLNRFSKVIVFRDLTPEHTKKIAAIQLRDLADTVQGRGITLTFSPEVMEYIAKKGYDPAFGARPLRRLIEAELRAPLAEQMLARKVRRGGTIHAVLRAEKIHFEVPGEKR